MTPAEEIKQAADKIRTLATAASTDTDGTPTTHWNSKDQGHGRSLLCGDYTTNGRGEQVGWPSLVRGGSFQRPSYMHTQHAEYAAAMDPTVGLAVATLLEGVLSSAREASPAHEECGSWCTPETCDLAAALAIARAINGSTA